LNLYYKNVFVKKTILQNKIDSEASKESIWYLDNVQLPEMNRIINEKLPEFRSKSSSVVLKK